MNKESTSLSPEQKGLANCVSYLPMYYPNIRGVLMTIIALSYTGMLEGAVLTETVFFLAGDWSLSHSTALFAG